MLNTSLSPINEEKSGEAGNDLAGAVIASKSEVSETSSGDESDASSSSSSSSSSDESSVKQRRRRRRRDRSLSRREMRRRNHKGFYESTDSESSTSRSISRSSSRSSRSYSRSYSHTRKYKSGGKKSRKRSRSRDYYKKRADQEKALRTPKYWPKNAVNNNYSSSFVNNTLIHPKNLMTSPRNFSTNDVRMGVRRRLQIFLDDPNSSSYAVAFALFIAFMVVISSIGVIIGSLPQFSQDPLPFWSHFEMVTLVIFTGELGLRCFAHSTSWKQFNRFFWSFSNFIDVIAVAPMFVEVIVFRGSGIESKRFMVFRLFRLIRLLHCYGYSSVLQLSMDAMFIALKKSKDALLAILFFQFFVIIIFSTLIFFFERGQYDSTKGKFMMEGEESKFDSIPATFWFVAEVITTVGLGDVWPKTVAGKLLSFPLMLFGLLIIALPSIVLGKNFAEAWLWLKTSGNIQKQAMLQRQNKAKLQKDKGLKKEKSKKFGATGKEKGNGEHMVSARDFAKEFSNPGYMDGGEKEPKSSLEQNHPPEYSIAIDIDKMEKGGIGGGSGSSGGGGSSEREREREEEANEEANMETVRSDQQYFVSTEALIESENRDEMLQLVQMLVEQFQQNTEVIDRLARQQDNLMNTVATMKKAQMRMISVIGSGAGGDEFTAGSTEDDRSRTRTRSRSRNRNRNSRSRSRSRSPRSRSSSSSRDRRFRDHSRSRSRNRSSRSRSNESRGRSKSKSITRLARSKSRDSSESRRGRSRGNSTSTTSRSVSSKHRHRRRVSSCSTCDNR